MQTSDHLTRRRLLALGASAALLSGCSATGDPSVRGPDATTNRARVALLLPLSGRRSKLGRKMARAVWLIEDLRGTGRLTEIVDAGGSPASARVAARRAFAQGADVIVGPLFRDQTPEVVETAGDVPVITLSNDASLASSGAWVFGATPEQSVDAVLRYAARVKASRLAYIGGRTPLGRLSEQALREGATEAGIGTLSEVEAANSAADMDAALTRNSKGVLPQILYVPGVSAEAQAQAIHALRAGVTTIGSLQWSGLGKDAMLRLDKACYTGPDPAQFNRLSSTYRSELDEEMGIIAALAVDAVAMAQRIGGRLDLSEVPPLDGLLGRTQFVRDRTARRDLAVLQIDGGFVKRVA